MRQKTEIKSGNKNKEFRCGLLYSGMHIFIFRKHRNTSAFPRTWKLIPHRPVLRNQLWIIVRHSLFGLPEPHADENVPKKLWNEL